MKAEFASFPERDPLPISLCRLLYDIRTRLNLKPADVARLAHFSEPTYHGMESGKTQSSIDYFIRAFQAMKIYPSLAFLAAESAVNPSLPFRIDVDFLLKNRMP